MVPDSKRKQQPPTLEGLAQKKASLEDLAQKKATLIQERGKLIRTKEKIAKAAAAGETTPRGRTRRGSAAVLASAITGNKQPEERDERAEAVSRERRLLEIKKDIAALEKEERLIDPSLAEQQHGGSSTPLAPEPKVRARTSRAGAVVTVSASVCCMSFCTCTHNTARRRFDRA